MVRFVRDFFIVLVFFGFIREVLFVSGFILVYKDVDVYIVVEGDNGYKEDDFDLW